MILYPAIDIKDGQCVRLLNGDMSLSTVFNKDPAHQAKTFEAAGCRNLHVVDLDGAIEGQSINSKRIEAILENSTLKIQLGGGIRSPDSIERWLSIGIDRVIVGTLALSNPALVKSMCKNFPNQIGVAIDARDGLVATEGWVKQSKVQALDLALSFEDAGASVIVYTDINRDGAMKGLNIEATVLLAQKLTTPLIASGGVTNITDLKKLKAYSKNKIEGVIVGRAFYEGKVDITEALNIMNQQIGENIAD